jgi:hypothetical protein
MQTCMRLRNGSGMVRRWSERVAPRRPIGQAHLDASRKSARLPETGRLRARKPAIVGGLDPIGRQTRRRMGERSWTVEQRVQNWPFLARFATLAHTPEPPRYRKASKTGRLRAALR